MSRLLTLAILVVLSAGCATATPKATPPAGPRPALQQVPPPTLTDGPVLDCANCQLEQGTCLRHARPGSVGPATYECQKQCCFGVSGEAGAGCKTNADCQKGLVCYAGGCEPPAAKP